LLIEHGADVNKGWETDHSTPLHAAVSSGAVEAVKILLAAGAAVNAQDSYGDTPLATLGIVRRDFSDWKQMEWALLDNGADPTIKNKDGETAIECVKRIALRHKDPRLTKGIDEFVKIIEIYHNGKDSNRLKKSGRKGEE
jgi:hypothetical protein